MYTNSTLLERSASRYRSMNTMVMGSIVGVGGTGPFGKTAAVVFGGGNFLWPYNGQLEVYVRVGCRRMRSPSKNRRNNESGVVSLIFESRTSLVPVRDGVKIFKTGKRKNKDIPNRWQLRLWAQEQDNIVVERKKRRNGWQWAYLDEKKCPNRPLRGRLGKGGPLWSSIEKSLESDEDVH